MLNLYRAALPVTLGFRFTFRIVLEQGNLGVARPYGKVQGRDRVGLELGLAQGCPHVYHTILLNYVIISLIDYSLIFYLIFESVLVQGSPVMLQDIALLKSYRIASLGFRFTFRAGLGSGVRVVLGLGVMVGLQARVRVSVSVRVKFRIGSGLYLVKGCPVPSHYLNIFARRWHRCSA